MKPLSGRRWRIALLWACITLLPSKIISQTQAPEALTIEQGLSQGMVYDVLQTRDGFLWVGTKDGLNRYDGYNFKVWVNNPHDPFSISDNTVTRLLEDSRGWIWVGGENQTINLFDRKTQRFFHLALPAQGAQEKQVLFDVLDMIEDSLGRIWIANRGAGVFCITIPANTPSSLPDTPDLTNWFKLQTIQFPPPSKEPGKALQEEYADLFEQTDGSIWVGSSRGAYKIDFNSFVAKSLTLTNGLKKSVHTLLQTSNGDIWGGHHDGIFSIKNGQYRFYEFGPHQEIGTTSVLKLDAAGKIWMLFEKKLWHIDPHGEIDLSKPAYSLDKPANTLEIDKQGNLWIGTLGYGLRKIVPRKSMFHASVKGTSIWGVWQDPQQRILCKLFNKMVYFNPATQTLSSQSAFPDALPQQNDLLFEPSGDYWLLCGLREGVVNRSELRHYRADGALAAVYPIAIDRYPYARLMRTSKGQIWVSGTSGRLLRCDPATGNIEAYDFGKLFDQQATSVQIIALVEDGNGDIWAGTSLGLVKGVVKANSIDFQLFKAVGSEKEGLNNNSIACILPDPVAPDQRLWIGTKGGGINIFDIKTGKVQYITTDQGLPNNVVYGILTDRAGHFWGSTNRGLFRLTMRDDQVADVKVFTRADGLQGNEFNTQAFYKSSDGALLFGGVDGLNRFYPEMLELNDQPPQVRIVGIEINHQAARFSPDANGLPAPSEYLRELELQPDQNNISFEFAALDFTDPAKNHYRYQLLPLEKEWVEAREKHFAHYTHLAPGTYTFRVQGSNSDGAWNNEAVEIKVVVLPPWWRTRWAWLMYIITACAIVWLVYREHIRSIRLKAQVAFEQRESERIRALEQMKTNFFANVAHEFRTPLTLIIEPLRQALKMPQQSEWLSNIGLAERNSQKLLQLVNELLDLAKIESGAMQPEYKPGWISDILRPVVDSFVGAALNKQIDLSLDLPTDIRGNFDADKVEKICFNLVSNALKFTPSGGAVRVVAQCMHDEHDEAADEITILVIDNGPGIAAADLPRIFDRFYQAQESTEYTQAGTGIGLALCRELTTLMGGRIHVESKAGYGAVFGVVLPLRTQSDWVERSPIPAVSEQVPVPYVSIEKSDTNLPAEPSERPLLLLAEDNEELRAFLVRTLSESYEVLEAPDGRQAIELARQRVPDIVVSDIFMPHTDGIQLLDMIKQGEITSHIPVLLLTSRTALQNRIEGLQHGADAYLGKPFQTEELLAWIDNLLEGRRRLQEKYSGKVDTQGGADAAPTLESDAPAPAAEFSAIDQRFIERLRAAVEQEIDNENLSVEDLARQMTMSRSQLHRKMSALTGQSAGIFLRNYRLDRAMEMLQAQAGNVGEIAWKVGFGNSKYFSTAFKERFGMSPSEV